MSTYTLKDIALATGGKLVGDANAAVSHLLIDSRGGIPPKMSIFFAIQGAHHDGHKFIEELYHKGLRNFVAVQSALPNIKVLPEANFIFVDDTLDALQSLATFHRRRFSYPVVAITGSNGKTIVKEWTSQMMHGEKKVVRSPRSYNSQVGVPLSIWLMGPENDVAIFEAGISKPSEMHRLERMLLPDIGIITNIGAAHQENFNTVKDKLQEKLELFRHCSVIIYQQDQKIVDEEIHNIPTKGKQLFTWGTSETATLRILSQEEGLQTKLTLLFAAEQFDVVVPFADDASIENAMHTISLMLVLGFTADFIAERIHKLIPVAMRLEQKEGINGSTIINDSYNSDISSLTIALNLLNNQKFDKRTLILSDIFQSGKRNEELYAEVAALVKEKRINRIIGIGSAISANADKFEEVEKRFYSSTDDFLHSYHKEDFANEAILLKGSRSFQFERISRQLERQIHQTVLEINLNALIHNLNHFRSIVKPTTKMVAMVKAFSYGSGFYEIASILQYHRVDYLAVAFADEGVELREAGITMPIIVLNAEPGSFDLMINYNLEPEIYSHTALRRFSESAIKAGVTDYPIHVKLDTGMHRLGFIEMDLPLLIAHLKSDERLKVSSIFSHLAASDELVHDDFTKGQIDLFARLSSRITDELGYAINRHILNSAGIERFPEAEFDMVRLGIGLYGISAVDISKLEVVSTLRSTIVQIKDIPANESVGYGRKGWVNEPKRTATIPIGYADGLNRKLSNGVGKILVKGQLAPIIGNICMDTCMIDVTGIDVKEGDEVTIFGQNPTITDIASWIGTIPYEILTSISRRVKRIYIQE